MRKANGKASVNGTGAHRTSKASVSNGSSSVKTAAKSTTKIGAKPAVQNSGRHSSNNGLTKLAQATALPAMRPAVRPPAPTHPPADPRYAPYQDVLVAKRRELLGSLEETKFDTLARLGRVAEEDQAQMSHEEFISVQRNSMDYQALRLVDGALERIESGEYGVCQECEEEISLKRLNAIPWAKYCVHCQDRATANVADSNDEEFDSAGTW